MNRHQSFGDPSRLDARGTLRRHLRRRPFADVLGFERLKSDKLLAGLARNANVNEVATAAGGPR